MCQARVMTVVQRRGGVLISNLSGSASVASLRLVHHESKRHRQDRYGASQEPRTTGGRVAGCVRIPLEAESC